jgi:hypothetical protein
LRFGFGVVSPARGVGVGVDVGVDLRLGSLGRRRRRCSRQRLQLGGVVFASR